MTAATGDDDVVVLGVASRVSDGGPAADVTEYLRPLVHEAITDAGLSVTTTSWPECQITVSSDLWDGILYSDQPVGEVAGSHYREALKLTEDGLQAVWLAISRLASSQVRTVLVVAHCRPSLHRDAARVRDQAMECFHERRLGLSADDLERLVRSYWLERSGMDATALSSWRSLCRDRVGAGKYFEMFERLDLVHAFNEGEVVSPDLDGAVALVLGRARDFPEAPVSIAGVGFGAVGYGLGEARVRGLDGFTRALEMAVRQAGVDPTDIDLFELSDRWDYQAPLWMSAVLGTTPGAALDRLLASEHGVLGRCPINPSGGHQHGGVPLVGGLDRLASCYRELLSSSGADDGRHLALAHGCAGIAAQSHSVALLRDRRVAS